MPCGFVVFSHCIFNDRAMQNQLQQQGKHPPSNVVSCTSQDCKSY